MNGIQGSSWLFNILDRLFGGEVGIGWFEQLQIWLQNLLNTLFGG